jgi:lysophospholipase L1-like esterase
MNLGVSGENSLSILNEQLPAALLEIMERRDDGDPDTTVAVVTLDLGANDLLTHVGSSDCLDDARGSACQNRINAAMDQFEDNFHDIVEEINGALDSDGEFYIMTMYNPFDFGLGIPFEDFSDGIVEQMNDIIRAEADAVGAKLADPFPLTADTAGAWTNMLSGDIHPNEKGFQALAFSLAEAHGF